MIQLGRYCATLSCRPSDCLEGQIRYQSQEKFDISAVFTLLDELGTRFVQGHLGFDGTASQNGPIAFLRNKGSCREVEDLGKSQEPSPRE